MNQKQTAIVEYLQPHCHTVVPVALTFHTGGNKTETIVGAYYEQLRTPPAGAPNQAEYNVRGFYLASVPKCYIRRKKIENKLYGSPIVVVNHPICFQMTANNQPSNIECLDGEWYVACYYFEKPNQPHPAQPFGENCILSRAETGQLDQYEPKKYRRIPVEVQYE